MTLNEQFSLTKNALYLYEYPAFINGEIWQESQTSDIYKSWRQKAADDHEQTFIKRLHMQEFRLKDAPLLFRPPEITEPHRWVKELEQILHLLPTTSQEMLSKLQYSPFQSNSDLYIFLSPVLFYMEQRLLPLFHTEILSPKACRDMMENGYSRIKNMFQYFIADKLNQKTSAIMPQPVENLSEHYEDFADEMLQGGLRSAFLEYPCLGRSLIESIDLWANYMEELAGNLMRDKPFTGSIEGINLSMGDAHNYGRAVAIAEYDTGKKLVYKPQNGALYNKYGALLEFLTEIGVIYPMRYAKLQMSRQDHCYIEFIEHSPITDRDNGAKRYYERIGQLICLFYVLGAEDMHNENIIAAGEYPVAVDLETLLTAKIESKFDDSLSEEPHLIHKVMRTIMLVIGDGAFSGAALSHSDKKNVPYFANGEKIDFHKVGNSILDGFTSTYQKMIQHKEAIYQKVVDLFQTCQIRSVLRSTQTYYDMLDYIQHIGHLSDGLTRSFAVERLFLTYAQCEDDEQLKNSYPVFAEECRAILRGDIPYFYTKPDAYSLFFDGSPLCRDFFKQSAFENVKMSLEHMGEEDLSIQCKLMEMTFQSVVPKDHAMFTENINDVPLLTNQQLIFEAEKLFDIIMSRRITLNRKSAYLDVQTVKAGNLKGRSYIELAGSGFYSGTLGYAMFFAALYSVTNDPKYRECTIQLIDDMCQQFTYTCGKTQVGMAEGVGGLALALHYIAKYIDAPGYEDLARKILFMPTDLKSIETIDYLAGLSGYIVAAHKVKGCETLIQQAADRLVSMQIDCQGFKVFKSDISKKPLIGMGHGLSGAALALIKAYDLFHKEEYLRCAMEALAYESSFYDENNGWPDLRDGRFGYMCGFCSGAPGIGMSRLEMMGASKELDQLLLSDIDKAVNHVSRHLPCLLRNDDLCCGNTSAIDFLITLGKERNDASLLLSARKRLSWIISRKNAIGVYGNDSTSNLEMTGFFNGVCGIGYAMLRLASEKVEKVL